MHLNRSKKKLVDAREATEEDEDGYEKKSALLRSQISFYESHQRLTVNELRFRK